MNKNMIDVVNKINAEITKCAIDMFGDNTYCFYLSLRYCDQDTYACFGDINLISTDDGDTNDIKLLELQLLRRVYIAIYAISKTRKPLKIMLDTKTKHSNWIYCFDDVSNKMIEHVEKVASAQSMYLPSLVYENDYFYGKNIKYGGLVIDSFEHGIDNTINILHEYAWRAKQMKRYFKTLLKDFEISNPEYFYNDYEIGCDDDDMQ